MKFELIRTRSEPKQNAVFAGETVFTFEVLCNGLGTGVFLTLEAECEEAFRALGRYRAEVLDESTRKIAV